MHRQRPIWVLILFSFISMVAQAAPMSGKIEMYAMLDDESDDITQEVWFTESNSQEIFLIENADFDQMMTEYHSGDTLEIDAEILDDNHLYLNQITAHYPKAVKETSVRNVAFFAINVEVASDPQNNLPADWESEMKTIKQDIDEYMAASTFNKLLMPADVNGDGQPDVFGMYTYVADGKKCERANYRDAANAQAAAEGVDLSLYNTRAYLIYGNTNCRGPSTTPVACDDCDAWIHAKLKRIIIRTFGFNLGMRISSQDLNDTLAAPAGRYNDFTSPMGRGDGGWHAPNMVQMNWLDSANIKDTTLSGTYVLSQLYAGDCCQNTKVIRIPRLNNNNYSYYVSYRENTGVDEPLGDGIANKIHIHTHDGKSTPSRFVAAIAPGETWTANDGSNMTIKHLTRSNGQAAVEIVR